MQLAARALGFAALLIAPLFVAAPPAAAGYREYDNQVVVSFDGTPIVFTLFSPISATGSTPAPLVLRGHGWGGSRETIPSGTTLALLNAGYNVLTWDARGFGQSGGKAELDSPSYEVRDVRALLDSVQNLGWIQRDATGAVVAMSGVSYAGGIQWLTSAVEPRIRAIAPEITWNDLRYSLAPNNVVKNQWVQLLFWAGLATSTTGGVTSPGPAGPQTGGYDTNLPTYFAEVMATNGPTPDVAAALLERSATNYSSQLRTPALLIQGWPDSLFNVNEAVANYQATVANGAAAKMILYCGGHAGCPYDATGERAHIDQQIVAWFDRYVKGLAVDTGAPVEWYSSDNVLQTATAWPIPRTNLTHASNYLDVVATPAPTSGGVVLQSGSGRPNQVPLQGARLTIPVPNGSEITGIPHVRVDLGTGTAAVTKDATLFARLVDTTTGKILDDQVTPLRFSGNTVVDVNMTAVSYKLPAGNTLALEVTANDAAFLASRFPGLLEFRVDIDVPTV